MKSFLKLGTRRSLLAWAQSAWVAREAERANPGVKVELVGIETRGDREQAAPLSKMDGKEFFVAEIDESLSAGRVDFTVHSMKDLSLERPRWLRLAAIPRRENPRDVVLFGPGVLEKLRAGQVIRIGTSSPRRLENIPGFVAQALPRVGGEGAPKLDFLEIRGNVNTRLSRVHEPLGRPRALDGVVLAFAGLIRLWADERAGRPELARLLDGVRWMVLPLRECPAAPAQGALAVECRADDSETFGILSRLHDTATQRHVSVERRLLAEWGGGCHQSFGATSCEVAGLGDLFFVRGRAPDSSAVDELRWKRPEPPVSLVNPRKVWDGSVMRATFPSDQAQPAGWCHSGDLSAKRGAEPGMVATRRAGPERLEGSVFIAHARAAEGIKFAQSARLWTSGVTSWKKLAAAGHWVEGCAEGFGFDHLNSTLREGVLRLPRHEEWTILTHQAAAEGWGEANVVATYRVPLEYSEEAIASLREADCIFWSSSSQFKALRAFARHTALHCCGPGKTASHLKDAGLKDLKIFPGVEEWRKWLKIRE